MKLKLVVDKLEEVAEAFRGLYVEKDGKFYLDVDGIEDTSGLKSALTKERKIRSDAEKDAAKWAKLGKTPEEIAELIAAQAADDEKKAKDAGEWDKLAAQLNEKHATALAAEAAKTAAMRAALDHYLIDGAATAVIAEAKGVPELLLPHVRSKVRVVESNGKYDTQVVDDKGDPRIDDKGAPMTIKDLVSEMRESKVFGRAFEATDVPSGSGAHISGGGGQGVKPGNIGGNRSERASAIAQKFNLPLR